MSTLIIPSRWANLDLGDLRGTVLILGASDSGKTTLARYLFQQLCRQNLLVGYLDTDVGQSTLGLPTTMTLALTCEPADDTFPPAGARATYFVGSTTPRGHMLPLIVGAHRLQQKALALGAQVVLVDSTGLVDPAQGGQALKQWKIELLAPRVVIGLQQRGNLEPILRPLRQDDRVRCIDLDVSPHAVPRTREQRMARRQAQLARYFARARIARCSLQRWPVYDPDLLADNALLAFQDGEGFVLGLGVVDRIDTREREVLVRTPLESLDAVASLRFGRTRWDQSAGRDY